jgi:histidyl-tRNA synthetase
MKKRVPYLELSDPRWRLDQAVSLLHELAGEGHDDEDFLQFMDDLWKHLGFHSFQSTVAHRKILSNLKDLVSRGGRAHIILAAKLTDGLTIREAAEVTGLSVHQLIRAKNQLLDFDLQNIVLKVVKFI